MLSRFLFIGSVPQGNRTCRAAPVIGAVNVVTRAHGWLIHFFAEKNSIISNDLKRLKNQIFRFFNCSYRASIGCVLTPCSRMLRASTDNVMSVHTVATSALNPWFKAKNK